MNFSLSEISENPWVALGIAAFIAIIVGFIIQRVARTILRRVTRALPIIGAIERATERPLVWVLPLILLQFVVRAAPNDLPGIGVIQQGVLLALMAALTWFVMSVVSGIGAGVIASHPLNVGDNLLARSIHTQTRLLVRTAVTIIIVLGFATMLMTFPSVRAIGTGLLASAGVAGLVVGMAARPVLSNLFAGVQLALTQPIRIDDVLIVEGEWGRVEEIKSTYVVLKIWDLRRLIIPLQWFIEKPFQNWTRTESDIIGTVFWWVDYRMPLQPLREELERLCREAPEWDGKLALIQVTDTDQRAIQIRALVSAANSGAAWDLRCRVREGMVTFIQRAFPQYLPVVRAELSRARRAEDNENQGAASPAPA